MTPPGLFNFDKKVSRQFSLIVEHTLVYTGLRQLSLLPIGQFLVMLGIWDRIIWFHTKDINESVQQLPRGIVSLKTNWTFSSRKFWKLRA